MRQGAAGSTRNSSRAAAAVQGWGNGEKREEEGGAIAAAGIPVLCSCGPIGEFNHNVREYAVVDSLFERAKIYALTVTEIDKL